MDFIIFDAKTYRSDFSAAIEDLLPSLKSANDDASVNALKMIKAMDKSIDVMERVQADFSSAKNDAFQSDDITQIGDYALTILDELSIISANRGLQHCMSSLHQLSVPVAMWIADHEGKISKLDIVVNAIANYANTLKKTEQLVGFCETVRKVVFSVTDEIKMDMEATNSMRPWRILNLNWGIVATRSHKVENMELVFDQLIKNIPADAGQFFKEGMQQMAMIDYPEQVKDVMEKYTNLFKEESSLH